MANIYVNYPEVAEGAPIEVPGFGVLANGTSSADKVNESTINWMALNELEVDLYLPPAVIDLPDLTWTTSNNMVEGLVEVLVEENGGTE
jgi:hypothetical protein